MICCHAALQRQKAVYVSNGSLWFCLYEYCFTSLSAQSWQYRDRRKPEAGTMPYSYFE